MACNFRRGTSTTYLVAYIGNVYAGMVGSNSLIGIAVPFVIPDYHHNYDADHIVNLS